MKSVKWSYNKGDPRIMGPCILSLELPLAIWILYKLCTVWLYGLKVLPTNYRENLVFKLFSKVSSLQNFCLYCKNHFCKLLHMCWCLLSESALNQMMKLLKRKDLVLHNNLVSNYVCVCVRMFRGVITIHVFHHNYDLCTSIKIWPDHMLQIELELQHVKLS